MAGTHLCRTLVVTALLAVFLSIFAAPGLAAQRVALVIGNASYAHAPALANPLNDAADIGAALGRLGFAVTRLDNADQAALRRGLQEFALAASALEIAVVFYAGHGIEVDQRNFLVPVDARLLSDRDVEFETVPLELVSRAVERAKGLRLIILDACRENPFAPSMQRAGATRAIGRGLARIEPSGETLVAYAAKEGTLASDGAGRNSPYSAALLGHLEEPGLEVYQMFRKVRDAVLASTGGRQEPFTYGSLSSQGAYLAARPAAAGAPSKAATPAASGIGSDRLTAEQIAAERLAGEKELLFWESVKDSEDPADLQAYLDRYPGGTYETLARNRLKRMADTPLQAAPQVAAVPARPAPKAPSVSPSSASAQESVEASLGLERSERRRIQEGLSALGFDPGSPDGLFGRGTRGAIGKWQTSRGEATTGYLDAESAKVLLAAGSAAARAKAEAERKAREARARAEAERKARERAAMEPVKVFRDCDGCPEMVVLPAGSFMMGSPSSEEGRDGDEGPVHRVTIPAPFGVGKYEVTFSEWDSCVSSGGCGDYLPFDWGWGRDRRPVVHVSWDDAKRYVSWLSRKTGKRYRLLTESEWEYAARAGTTGPFHFGSTISTDQANYNGDYTYGPGRKGVDRKKTVPVGSFPSNGFGLHDMHGNIWEWVEDCWHGSYAGAPSDGRAWVSGGNCEKRLLRGGSWNFGPGNLRSAFRFRFTAGFRYYFIGFRVARTLTP